MAISVRREGRKETRNEALIPSVEPGKKGSLLVIRLDGSSTGDEEIIKMSEVILANLNKDFSGRLEPVRNINELQLLEQKLSREWPIGRAGMCYQKVVLAAHSSYLIERTLDTPLSLEKRRIGDVFSLEVIAEFVQFLVHKKLTRDIDFYCCESGMDLEILRVEHPEALSFKHELVGGELHVKLTDLPESKSLRKELTLRKDETYPPSTLEWVARCVHNKTQNMAFRLRGFCGAGVVTSKTGTKMISIHRSLVPAIRVEEVRQKKGRKCRGAGCLSVTDAEVDRVIEKSPGIHGIHTVVIHVEPEFDLEFAYGDPPAVRDFEEREDQDVLSNPVSDPVEQNDDEPGVATD